MKNTNTKKVHRQKASEKKKGVFPVFKLMIVVVCIAIYAICLYAGISGEFDFLQIYIEQHTSKNIAGYRWTVIGIFSAVGFTVCIDSVLDALNLFAGRKNHKRTVFALGFVIPTTVLFILNIYRSFDSFAGTVFCISIILIVVLVANLSDITKYFTKGIK